MNECFCAAQLLITTFFKRWDLFPHPEDLKSLIILKESYQMEIESSKYKYLHLREPTAKLFYQWCWSADRFSPWLVSSYPQIYLAVQYSQLDPSWLSPGPLVRESVSFFLTTVYLLQLSFTSEAIFKLSVLWCNKQVSAIHFMIIDVNDRSQVVIYGCSLHLNQSKRP